MGKSKDSRKKKKGTDRPSLSEEEQIQLQMLLDRLAAQDPEGETFNQFLESLKPLLSRSLAFDLALVEALGAMTSPVAVELLKVFQEMPLEKPLRRAVKTALFRLNQHGLGPRPEKTESVRRVLVPRPADRQAEAWASWPESGGERGAVLKLPHAGRGYLLAIAVLDPEVGFRDFKVMQTSRKGVKSLLAEITGGDPERLAAVPVQHARFLLEEAAALHRQQKRTLPPDYDPTHRNLCSWADAPCRAHIYELLDAEEIGADSLLLHASESLLEVEPFSSWRLQQEAVGPFAEKVRDLRESRLVISETTQLELLDQVIREAAVEIFTPELRQRYRRLLEESALHLFLENRLPEAKRALAAAIDLTHEMGRLSENSFILGLVRQSIGAEVIQDSEKSEHRRGEERSTESGLIIPG
ncbi:MAG: hypothetical protein ACLFVT_01400 [Syntrophobacteria bacterium]